MNRINNNSENNNHHSHKPKGRRDQQAPHTKDNFEGKRLQLQDECWNFMYKQSSTASKISRQICLGIIGMVWIISFMNGHLIFINKWFIVTLISCVCFLIVDFLHYYLDSRSYYKETTKMDTYKDENDLRFLHETTMDKIFERSQWFFKIKFYLILVSSTLFIISLLSIIK